MIDLENEKSYLLPHYHHSTNIINKMIEVGGLDGYLDESEAISLISKHRSPTVHLLSGIDRSSKIRANTYDGSILNIFEPENIEYHILYPLINDQRTIKSEEEIVAMKEICKISSEGHIKMMQECKPGVPERFLSAVFQV